MNAESINLIIKILILLFLAATSQLAMHKRVWPTAIICSAVWISVFRLSILRAMMLYVGVFKKETPEFITQSSNMLRSGAVSNIADTFVLVATIILFINLATQRDK